MVVPCAASECESCSPRSSSPEAVAPASPWRPPRAARHPARRDSTPRRSPRALPPPRAFRWRGGTRRGPNTGRRRRDASRARRRLDRLKGGSGAATRTPSSKGYRRGERRVPRSTPSSFYEYRTWRRAEPLSREITKPVSEQPSPAIQSAKAAGGGNRTHTGSEPHGILSPARLPVSPLRPGGDPSILRQPPNPQSPISQS